MNVSYSLTELARIATDTLSLQVKIAYLNAPSQFVWHTADVKADSLTIWVGNVRRLSYGGLSALGKPGVFSVTAWQDDGTHESITISTTGAVLITDGDSEGAADSQDMRPVDSALSGTGNGTMVIRSPRYGDITFADVGISQMAHLKSYAEGFADNSKWWRLNEVARKLHAWRGDVDTIPGYTERQLWVASSGEEAPRSMSTAEAIRRSIYGGLTHFVREGAWVPCSELIQQ